MSLTLVKALRIKASDVVAFIGSGGKTTAIFQLARQNESSVIVTATSHLGTWQVSKADTHIIASSGFIDELEKELNGVILVTGSFESDRTKPIADDLLDELHRFCKSRHIPLLIEADGSRQRPLKAWAEHEPPIPAFVNHVVLVTGLSGLGNPLNDEFVHRPELFINLSGLNTGEPVDTHALTRVLLHDKGGLKNIPQHARRSVLLNQADIPALQASAHTMAQPVLSTFDSVIIASLEQKKIFAVHEQVAGIILAAGESSRYGQPKQLLDWQGEPFVRVVARKAVEAGLSPVIVVTGANAEQVEVAINDLDVKIVRSSEWKKGQSTSIKAGISFILENEIETGAAIFLLVDQPQITTSILGSLAEKHAEGLYPIVAPMVMDRRANPVLFDSSTFQDLLTLEGDVGGRAIFHKYHVEYLPWHDDRLLLDVDTPEQYQRLITDETL
jgi:molybdenum cofactor cytidylyltransferase